MAHPLYQAASHQQGMRDVFRGVADGTLGRCSWFVSASRVDIVGQVCRVRCRVRWWVWLLPGIGHWIVRGGIEDGLEDVRARLGVDVRIKVSVR